MELSPGRKKKLALRERQFRRLKAELAEIGYVLQGSLMTRWMECGKPLCGCHEDLHARHGPYYQWSGKSAGKTVSRYLRKDQSDLCRVWIEDNRRLEKLMKRLRGLSLRVAELYEITVKR